MSNGVVAALAFLAGNVVGVGVLFGMGEFSSPPAQVQTPPLNPPPTPSPVPSPSSSPVAVATPTPTPVAAPAPTATVAMAAPTPTPAPAPTTAQTPTPINPQPKAQTVASVTPPHESEPSAPNGKLIVAGMGEAALSVSADKVRKGKKVTVPLMKPDGSITTHSPDGTFTLEIRYKTEGSGLKASIDCSPMALLTADGQTATHLSGLALGKAPTRVDVKGGSAGEFSFILSHQK